MQDTGSKFDEVTIDRQEYIAELMGKVKELENMLYLERETVDELKGRLEELRSRLDREVQDSYQLAINDAINALGELR